MQINTIFISLISVPYSPYFPHIHDYNRMSKEKPDQFLCLCYEDMKENPAKEVRKVAKFLGLEVTEAEVDSVVSKTSFEAMKGNPLTNYEHWKIWGMVTPGKNREFFRKGIVGDHKNHFIDKYLLEDFEDWIEDGVEDTDMKFKFE